MMRRYWVLILSVLGLFPPLSGQEIGNPYIHNYNPREYKASSANFAAVQDQRGIMYFGNLRGVLEFDGYNWRLINLPNDESVRSLAVDSLGTVYVGAPGELGYLYADSLNRMHFHSFMSRIDGNYQDDYQVIGLERGALFRTSKSGKIYFADPDTLRVFEVPEARGWSDFFRLNGKLLTIGESGLVSWNEDLGAFVPVAGGEVLREKVLMNLLALGPDQALIRLGKGDFRFLTLRDGRATFTRFRTEIDDRLQEEQVSSLEKLGQTKLIIGTVKNGIYVLDREGQLLQHLNEQSGLQDNFVINCFMDQHQSLWLTLSRGISRLEIADPLKHWDESLGLNGIVFSTHRHRGTLYAATALGVFYLEKNHFVQIPEMEAESWQFYSVPDDAGRYYLYVRSNRGLFELRGKRAIKVKNSKNRFSFYQSPWVPKRLYNLPMEGGVELQEWANGTWNQGEPLPGLVGNFQGMAEGPDGYLWLLTASEEELLIRAKYDYEAGAQLLSLDTIKQELPEIQGIYPLEDDLVFSTKNGIYRYVPEENRFYADTLLPFAKVGILRMSTDQQGNVWLACFQGPRRWLEVAWKGESGQYQRDTLLLKGLDNIEVWGPPYPENDSYVWIGASQGLYRFDLKGSFQAPAIPAPLIRKVEIKGDSLLPFLPAPDSMAVLQLDHPHNAIKFHFVSPFYSSQNGTFYRYRLKGWERDWSPWTSSLQKEFTLLPSGRYTFQLQARNRYDQLSEVTELVFDVRPPWYKTVWAFISYGLLVICMIYGTVKLNTQRLHMQNVNLERLVYERTAEIWEQHKLIVKRTVALKRQKAEVAEQHKLLERKNEELETTLDKLKNAQSHLVESEKMASLGQLTAGIAHEINNPINYVKNSVSPLKKDFSEIRMLFRKIRELQHTPNLPQAVDSIRHYAEEIDAEYLFEEMEQLVHGIEEGANRTASIVKGLKTFARADQDAFHHVDLHESIEATLTILANRLKNRIKVNKKFGDIPVCECMPGKINQVFMNLISNSVDAIEECGREPKAGEPYIGELTILTENINQKEVRITFTDSGCGMSPEIRQRIFDPFFTTKPVGDGTGLGLSITFGIVEKHGGSIAVDSKPGQGSTFVLVLPLEQED
jgi:signal transduction histidine kinase